MPTGQPDFYGTRPDEVEPLVDRIVREAMESGEFDDLPGTGKPLPGAGKVDDEMWWVRSWVERNRDSSDQPTTEAG